MYNVRVLDVNCTRWKDSDAADNVCCYVVVAVACLADACFYTLIPVGGYAVVDCGLVFFVGVASAWVTDVVVATLTLIPYGENKLVHVCFEFCL